MLISITWLISNGKFTLLVTCICDRICRISIVVCWVVGKYDNVAQASNGRLAARCVFPYFLIYSMTGFGPCMPFGLWFIADMTYISKSLMYSDFGLPWQWRHNDGDGVSNHQPFIQGVDQRKHQSSVSLAFVSGIHRWPVNSPHKGPETRKMFPFHNVIIQCRNTHRIGTRCMPKRGDKKPSGSSLLPP